MKQEEKLKPQEKLEIIFSNTLKLFLLNKELKYITTYAKKEDLDWFNSNNFLRLSYESLFINFCLLTSILTKDNEEYSILKFIKQHLKENIDVKKEVWNIIYDFEFQNSLEKILKLRDKCFAHKDPNHQIVIEETKLIQKELDLLTDGIVSAVYKIYYDINRVSIEHSFNKNQSAEISSLLNVFIEWDKYEQEKNDAQLKNGLFFK
jgi:hypothetical protein